ncbi:hypothetical protein LNQ03_28485 [Klebsiella pneumoniae subsp. pneumoniae]|nr:hypothetical protein [Klebsiella pneumoniae subsp. pneumoniae]
MSPWWRGSLWHQTRRSGDKVLQAAHRIGSAGAEKWRLPGHRRRCLCRYFCAERSFSAESSRRGTGGFLSADKLAPTIFGKRTPHRARSHPPAEPPSLMTRRRSRPMPFSAGGVPLRC